MEVTFKYVGQGDTIILEWQSESESHLGIVDCKSYAGVAPAIDHIRGRERVEFMILSHPHSDHYSGFPALLQVCEEEDIEIGFFIYTTREIRQFIRSIALSQNEKDDLADTFRAMIHLEKIGLIEKRGIGTDMMRPIEMADEVSYELLSPSESERDQLARSLYSEEMDINESPDANYVSAISLIDGGGWHILLTSDAYRASLKRIGLGRLKRDRTQLILGQSPHHGSPKNHYRAFWKNRSHPEGTPVAISVGPNGYGHPSEEVIDDFVSMNYDVQATYNQPTDHSHNLSAELDMISERTGTDSTVNAPRDLKFRIDVESGKVDCRGLPRR